MSILVWVLMSFDVDLCLWCLGWVILWDIFCDFCDVVLAWVVICCCGMWVLCVLGLIWGRD